MTAAASMSVEKSRDVKISRWFSQYANRLLRFVRSKIRDIDEAEDVAQDVWYQLSRQDDVDDIEQIGAWLFTAARNRVVNYYKKQKNVPFSALQPHDGEAGGEEDAAIDHYPAVVGDFAFEKILVFALFQMDGQSYDLKTKGKLLRNSRCRYCEDKKKD